MYTAHFLRLCFLQQVHEHFGSVVLSQLQSTLTCLDAKLSVFLALVRLPNVEKKTHRDNARSGRAEGRSEPAAPRPRVPTQVHGTDSSVTIVQ